MARRFVPLTTAGGTVTGCLDTATGNILPPNSMLCDPIYGAMVTPNGKLPTQNIFPATRAPLNGITAGVGTKLVIAGILAGVGVFTAPMIFKNQKIGNRILTGVCLFLVGWQAHDVIFKPTPGATA